MAAKSVGLWSPIAGYKGTVKSSPTKAGPRFLPFLLEVKERNEENDKWEWWIDLIASRRKHTKFYRVKKIVWLTQSIPQPITSSFFHLHPYPSITHPNFHIQHTYRISRNPTKCQIRKGSNSVRHRKISPNPTTYSKSAQKWQTHFLRAFYISNVIQFCHIFCDKFTRPFIMSPSGHSKGVP